MGNISGVPTDKVKNASGVSMGGVNKAIGTDLTPKQLFADGTNGVWLDPSDMSTLFQDSAGTIPVTAFEQPVGLILDKSKNLALGSESWIEANVTLNGESTRISPNVYRIYSSAGAFSGISVGGLKNGAVYRISFNIDSIANAGSGIVVNSGTSSSVYFTTTGLKTLYLLSTSTGCTFKRISTAVDYQVSNISIQDVTGNHAIQATSASRPVLQQDANGNKYLAFDGVDDFMYTAANLDMSGSDEFTSFIGTRLLRVPAVTDRIFELSLSFSTNNGAFANTNSPGQGISLYNHGTVAGFASAIQGVSITPPLSTVISSVGKISTDTTILRVNGAVIGSPTTDLGTGNYGNYPLYIGAKGGGTVYFLQGNIYSLVIANKNYSNAIINMIETWVNIKTRAY